MKRNSIDDLQFSIYNIQIAEIFLRFFYDLGNEGVKKFNPNSAIEKKEYFSILISNCVAVEKNKR